MNDLSKQQLILVALLVSFVTSLATGITTVSLMDQAPRGVVQTITQVVERTIQAAAPQSASVGLVSISVDDQIAAAVATLSPSMVLLKSGDPSVAPILGVIISSAGTVVTDASAVMPTVSYSAILPDGSSLAMSVIQTQTIGGIAFLAPSLTSGASPRTFIAASIATSSKLGQTVLSLAGTSTPVLGRGIITEIGGGDNANSGLREIVASISSDEALPGSPLFDVEGRVIGIKTAALSLSTSTDGSSVFYSLAGVRNTIPGL